jgi:hypothetical protein
VEGYILVKTSSTICGTAVSAPPSGDKKKLFSEVVCRKIEERHKLTGKPKDNQSTEEIKKLVIL